MKNGVASGFAKSLQAEIQTHQASRHHFRTTFQVSASRKVPNRTQPSSRTRQELSTAICDAAQAKRPNWRACRYEIQPTNSLLSDRDRYRSRKHSNDV